jgi:hypothetical protein
LVKVGVVHLADALQPHRRADSALDAMLLAPQNEPSISCRKISAQGGSRTSASSSGRPQDAVRS